MTAASVILMLAIAWEDRHFGSLDHEPSRR